MKIIINAYAVNPLFGSERGVGWRIIEGLSDRCDLVVFTELGNKEDIESVLIKRDLQIRFFYVDIGDFAREICWNQGDYRFYYYYRKWQRKVYREIRDLVSKESFDLVHHLNMIGYREPGYTYRLRNIYKVWGPVGGLSYFPTAYLPIIKGKGRLIWIAKNVVNFLQRYSPRVILALRNSDILLAATPEGETFFRGLARKESIIRLVPETGSIPVLSKGEYSEESILSILWIGRIIDSKGLVIAIKALAKIDSKKPFIFHVVGDGEDRTRCEDLAQKLGLGDAVIWHGEVPYSEIDKMYKNIDILLFTSLWDATSTVVMEALSYGIPVICHDRSGYGNIVTLENGYKIPVKNPDYSILRIADIINGILENRKQLKEKKMKARESGETLSWDLKSEEIYNIYCEKLGK